MLRAAVFALLAVAALAAPTPPPVVVTPTEATVREGREIPITFRLTEPITCQDLETLNCHVFIRIHNTRPDEIALSQCHVLWKADEWQEDRVVFVTGVEDFRDDGELEFYLVTELVTSGSEFYDGVNPPDILIKTQTRSTAQCSSTTDPNYVTFDGATYTNNNAGTYLLWAARHRDFEVQTRVTNGRNCAVAVRDRCDVVVFDQCSGNFITRSNIKSPAGEGMVVRRVDGGEAYLVTFPRENGAQVKVTLRVRINRHGQRSCGWSGCRTWYTYSRTEWLDVHVTAPSADFGYEDTGASVEKPRTTGMCGTFNNNRNDDPNASTSGNFAISHSKSLFVATPSCVQGPPRPPVNTEYCEFEPEIVQRPTLTQPDIEDITEIIKQTIVDQTDPRVEYDFSPVEIIPVDEINENSALTLCTLAITGSLSYEGCVNTVGVDPEKFINSCVIDLSLQADEELIFGSVDAFKEECEFLAIRNVTLFAVNDDGTLFLSDEQLAIGETLCKDECNFAGQCVRGRCVCEEGKAGDACQINLEDLPAATGLIPVGCDVRAQTGCNKVSVIGEKFLYSPNVTCKVGPVRTSARFVGPSEIICDLPEYTHSGALEKSFPVTVSTDGTLYSQPIKYTYFDSKCQICPGGDALCTRRPNTCTIQQTCYTAGEASAENPCLVCNPDVNEFAFSFSYADPQCGPIFSETSYAAFVAEADVKGTTVVEVDARNELLALDHSAVVHYSLDGADAAFFTIEAVEDGSAVVHTNADFNFEDKTSYSFTLVATDDSGHTATAPITVNIINVNEAPVFIDAEYTFTLAENGEPTTLFTVRATDADAEAPVDEQAISWGTIVYSLGGFGFASDAELFEISSTSGLVKTVAPLDFERRDKYVFYAQATDGDNEFARVPITITVTDVNEQPEFIALTSASVKENMPAGTVIGIFSTEDPDFDQTFTYQFVNGGSDVRVAIVAQSNGDITLVTTRPLNYEAQEGNTFSIEVRSTDSGSPALSTSVSFQIRVENANDKPTNIQILSLLELKGDEQSAEFDPSTLPLLTNLPEDLVVGSVIGFIVTEDEDEGQTHFYDLDLGDDNGVFSVVGDSLVLSKPLDFEKIQSHTLTIKCTDSGSPTLESDPVTITFAVDDLPDVPKNFRVELTADLAENTPVGTVVGKLRTSDDDPQQPMTLQLIDSPKFSLGTVTCLEPVDQPTECEADLTLVGTLDFETMPQEIITVKAVSSDTLEATRDVKIAVADVNEPVRGVLLVSNSIPSNMRTGSEITTLVADDVDATGEYTFTLASSGAPVSINGDKLILDQQFAGSVSFDVTVQDGTEFQKTVTLELESTPVVIKLTPASVDEFFSTAQSLDGTIVGSLSVDGVGLASPDFKLKSSTTQSFAISGATLQVSKYVLLDHETAPTVTVVISASFPSEDNLADVEQSITVTINDVNEPPVFSEEPGQHELARDTEVGTVVARFRAEDPDSDTISYFIGSGNDDGYFRLDGRSIVLAKSLKTHPVGNNNLRIRATDGQYHADAFMVYFVTGAEQDTRIGSSSSSSASIVPIVAGIIGALVFAALLVLLFVWYKRKQNERPMPGMSSATNPMYINPDGSGALPYQGAAYDAFVKPEARETDALIPGVTNPLYSWYQPDVSRDDVVDVLSDRPTGAFVIRDYTPTPGWHMLHTKVNPSTGPASIRDDKIRGNNGYYCLMTPPGSPLQPEFESLPQLVRHYATQRQTGLPVSLHVDQDIYDNSNLSGARAAAGGARFARDANAPLLPLKDRERAAVEMVAGEDGEDLYMNKSEARSALSSHA